MIGSASLILLLLTTTATAQENFVQKFLDRYRPPIAIDAGASTSRGPAPEAAIQQLIRQGTLPITLNDVIRLMIESNLDFKVSRFSPLTQQYLIDTLYRPFEPTLRLAAN